MKQRLINTMSIISAGLLLGTAALLALIGQRLTKMGQSFLKDIKL